MEPAEPEDDSRPDWVTPYDDRERYIVSAFEKMARDAYGATDPGRPQGMTPAEKHRWQMYGLTPAQYDLLLIRQRGICALCEKRDPVVVDHDHVNGRVRGLLCNGCNQALGVLGDGVPGLARALRYVSDRDSHLVTAKSI